MLITNVLLVQVHARHVPMLLHVLLATLLLELLISFSSITLAILLAQQVFIIIPSTVHLATRTVRLAQTHQLIAPHAISQRAFHTCRKDFVWVLVIKVRSVLTLIVLHAQRHVLLVYWILRPA